MLRNIASQKWRVYAWDTTTGAAKTGDAANISAYITIDDGTPAATNDAAPTEASSANQPGYYDFDLTQAETAGAKLSLAPKSATANIAVIACPPVVYTRPQYFSLLGIESDGDLTKVNTLHGHTAQSGDSYAIVNSGTHGNAALKTLIDAVDDYVDTEVAAIVSELAKVPKSDGTATWNATALASIQSECNDALVAYDPPTKAELDTAVANVSVGEIQATAIADLFNTDSGTTYASAVAGSAVKEIADNAGGASLTVQDIVDGVWDEPIASHQDAGSMGEALDDAGAAGTPPTAGEIADAVWDEARSGHTTNGTFGQRVLAQLDDGVTHGGTSALLRLGSSTSTPAFYATNSGGNVVRFQATGGNGTALKLDADGTGHGLAAVGGATDGDGFNLGGGGGGPAGAGAAINGGLLGNVTGNVSGSVGSVTGAVGSVTGNVGGNVTGSIGSLATQAKADVNAEVDSAIETYHLDHLLAATYDPASKPGAADALLNELVESDAGVARFTENALEQAPSGVGAGDWTSDEKTAIRSILGIPASGTTPDDPTVGILDTIRDAVGVVDGTADTIASELAKVPKSDGTATWNATALASIQSECNDALVAYDPPTNAEMEARTLAAASYATAANQVTIAGYLDTEIAAILAAVDTEVAAILADTNELQTDLANGGRLDVLIDAIKAKTDNLPAAPAATGDIPTVAQIWTTALTEAYRATGATGTAAQLLYEILQNLTEFSNAGTTKTVKKLDGSTTAKTYTYDDATNPTSISETT